MIAAFGEFGAVVVAGFLSGGIGSGSLQGAMVGAFSAGVFHGIGRSMGDKVTAGKVLAHGMAGGVMSELQGGKFGHGFASAAVTQLMSPVISRVNDTDTDFNAGRVAVAALVGGATSAITGGKFANGALTAAFSRAYNDESQPIPADSPGVDLFLTHESDVNSAEALNYLYPDGYFVISAHGNSDRLEDERFGRTQVLDSTTRDGLAANSARAVSPRQLRNMLLDPESGYMPGTPIMLVSCNAGRGDDSFAKRLAIKMRVEVIAADGYTTFGPTKEGRLPYVFAHIRFDAKLNGNVPIYDEPGRWRRFQPGG